MAAAGCPPDRASLPSSLLGLGGLQALASGGGRRDEQFFCSTGLHASAPSTVTISCYLRATTNESNHRAHRVHRGRTETFYPEYCGTFDPSPNPKSHDNHLIAAGSLVGCPTGPGLDSGQRCSGSCPGADGVRVLIRPDRPT